MEKKEPPRKPVKKPREDMDISKRKDGELPWEKYMGWGSEYTSENKDKNVNGVIVCEDEDRSIKYNEDGIPSISAMEYHILKSTGKKMPKEMREAVFLVKNVLSARIVGAWAK